MNVPAAENVKFPDNLPLAKKDSELTGFTGITAQQGAAL
jgi:hypothetical protein